MFSHFWLELNTYKNVVIEQEVHCFNCKSNAPFFLALSIKVITKLPNSEQSYKGKVKTHNYINRQNQSTSRKTVKTVMTLTWYRHF